MAVSDVEVAFVAAAAGVQGVYTALDNVPKQAPTRLPAVMLLWRGVNQEFQETGPVAQVSWAWTVFVWIALTNYERAQDDAKTLIPRLLVLPRTNRTLGGTCESWALADDLDQPVFDEERGVYEKTLRMTATAEETW